MFYIFSLLSDWKWRKHLEHCDQEPVADKCYILQQMQCVLCFSPNVGQLGVVQFSDLQYVSGHINNQNLILTVLHFFLNLNRFIFLGLKQLVVILISDS